MKIMVLNKHKCGRIVALSLLSFSLIFFGGLFGLFFFRGHLWPLFVYGLRWPLLFPHMGQCSINDDHHTYNSKLRAMMTLYGMPSVVYRGNDLAWHRHQWKHHASYLTIMHWQCRRGGTYDGGSCMAIYLGMTLKKP